MLVTETKLAAEVAWCETAVASLRAIRGGTRSEKLTVDGVRLVDRVVDAAGTRCLILTREARSRLSDGGFLPWN